MALTGSSIWTEARNSARSPGTRRRHENFMARLRTQTEAVLREAQRLDTSMGILMDLIAEMNMNRIPQQAQAIRDLAEAVNNIGKAIRVLENPRLRRLLL